MLVSQERLLTRRFYNQSYSEMNAPTSLALLMTEFSALQNQVLALQDEVNYWKTRAAANSHLNPDAAEFVPTRLPTLADAIRTRLAKTKAEDEAARKAAAEKFKAAVTARLAKSDSVSPAPAPAPSTPTVKHSPWTALFTKTIRDKYKFNEPPPSHAKDFAAYKADIVGKIEVFLNEFHLYTSAEKIVAAAEMFRYLADYGMPLLRRNLNLYNTIIMKCWELKMVASPELHKVLDWHIRKSRGFVPQSFPDDGTVETYRKNMEFLRNLHDPIIAAKKRADIPIIVVHSQKVTLPVVRRRTRTQTGAISRKDYADGSESD